MAATRTPRSGYGALPAMLARPLSCETGRCHRPGGSCGQRTGLPEPPETRETPFPIWYRPLCRLARPSCSLHRRRRPSSRFAQVQGLQVACRLVPTSASEPDVGGSPFHPERSAQNRRHRGSLFFEAAQLRRRFLERRFVALPFHRVLGALKRKAFLFHDPSQLIVAEADTRLFEQVGVQPGQRPNAEPVSQVLRWRLDRGSQGGPILGRRPRWPPWRLAGNQTVQTVLAVAFAHDVDCPN